MTVETVDWEMYSHNDKTLIVTVLDDDDVAVNITGWDLRLEIKEDEEIATIAYLTKTSDDVLECSLVTPLTGIAEFYIVPADFATAPRYGFSYYYAVKGKTAAGKEYNVVDGRVKFKRPIFTVVP